MPRFLPDKERPARQVRAGDEIYVLNDSAWRRIRQRIDLPHTIKFVLVTGREHFAERGQRVRSRCISDEG